MRPSTANEISEAYEAAERAVHRLNYVVGTGELEGIRKAEIEKAANRANDLFGILARDQNIHEGYPL